ncbi:MAG: redoxin domain-containing protein, partial [Planctomycetales bacterium]|nr:redoxin domain-containing protein [Planctomycetales bacterium]
YRIRQGQSHVVPWEPPAARIPCVASTPESEPDQETARIVLPARLPLPAVRTVPADGGPPSELSLAGPVLLSVWSTTCMPCLTELGEWSQNADEFAAHGLDVVALNVDAANSEFDLNQAGDLLARLGFKMRSAIADPESIHALDYFQRATLDRWKPLPLPCSFLVDSRGEVLAIYKGRVSREQLWRDMELLDAEAEQVRVAAAPFPGRWHDDIVAFDPTLVSSQMIDHDLVPAAIDYLGRYIATYRDARRVAPQKLADTLYVQAILLNSQNRTTEANDALRAATSLNPTDLRFQTEYARTLEKADMFAEAQQVWLAAYKINRENLESQQGLALNLLRQEKYDLAAKWLERMRAGRPNDAMIHFRLATTYGNLRQSSRAIASYERTLELQPNFALAANNLAWLLATLPDDALRDGARAVKLARHACEISQYKEPQFLDTLSVAYAEVRDFKLAIETGRRALEQFRAAGRSTPAQERSLQARLLQFEQQRPFRE